MKTTVQPSTSVAQSAKAAPLSAATQKAWSVNFAAPPSMPSDRLKARAELVRSALTTGTY